MTHMDLTCLVRQEFDSEAFGLDFYRVVRLDPEALKRELSFLSSPTSPTSRCGPFMADAKTPVQDIEGAKSLMRLGFGKVCVQPTYVLDLSGRPRATSGEPVGSMRTPGAASGAPSGATEMPLAGEEPVGAIEMPGAELDAHAANFPFSRFGLDPSVADFERIAHQRRWLANTMASADILKLLEPGAFVSFKLKDGAAMIDLVSVLPQARGSGSRLLGRLTAWAGSRGLDRVEVTTESENIAACLFYQKNGFRLARATAAFHLRSGGAR